ncbi:PREDICTED: pheromone-binding protein Gp-9-like [Vollenhovia emeryi]|uniref:pheromone-binding protein Gp-9-like n=1 Tax=Vollenhovia emeryi TaxID=411798 RepID=UPI0005F3D025|nr:PREDICTED: pheromone-binding protein Gp-9-like [Vollenhovia emeryi]
MKRFIFYICTFVLISFAVGSKFGSRNKNYNTCLTENDVSDDDMLTAEDIIQDKYKQSEHQEKLKKNGCIYQCVLQKEGLMEGSEYDVEKMHSEFTKRSTAPVGSEIFTALDSCINETKDLTEKCEKAFSLTKCFLQAEERIYPTPGNNEEHEHKSE